MSGTFDKIKWSAILKCVDENNMNENLIRLIKSFPGNRKVEYHHKEKRVYEQKFSAGVPLGSALSLKTFNVAMAKVH